VILQEGPPGLRRWLADSHHILANTGLADVDAQLEQFAVDARRGPKADCRGSFGGSVSVFPGRQAAVPVGRGAPSRSTTPETPYGTSQSPSPVSRSPGQTASRSSTATTGPREIDPQRSASVASPSAQNVELMAKSEHLNLKSGPSAEAIPHRCQNGHQRRSWGEETDEAQLPMYQPNPSFRKPLVVFGCAT
jgi:hypothetical protein